MKKPWILKILFGALIVGALIVATMYLWNWLMPEIFGLTTITFWQAFGLLLLSKIFFGLGKGKHHHHGGSAWKNQWKEKWSTMSDEERNQWKERFASKWCTKHHQEHEQEPKV